MNELRVTDTNSANDSRGRAFGLEGNDFVYVLVAFVAALGFYLALNLVVRVHAGVALAMALPLLLVPLAWVVLLRRNRPQGYAEDWFEQRSNGEGWSFAGRTQPTILEGDRRA
jgi:hypothetical protein